MIIGHIYKGDNPFIIWIYSFHVPLFFIISGSLLYYKDSMNKNIVDLFKSRANSILKSYFLFSLLNLVFEIILNPSIGTVKWTLIQIITLFGIGATWFLPALFISELTFMLIYKYISNKFSKIIFIILLSIIPFVCNSNYIMLTVIFRSLTSLTYISIGFYIFKYINKAEVSWLSIVLLFILSLVLSIINGPVDLYSLLYNNSVIYLLCGIIGSVFILITLKKLEYIRFKGLTYIGVNSIVIMATHQNIIRIFQRLLGNQIDSFISGTLLLVTILIIEIPLVYIINNYLPWILGKSNKKKTTKMAISS